VLLLNATLNVIFQRSASDDERRSRRRERNKVAATKCRNKKKEQTSVLMVESHSVKNTNSRLKQEILRLQAEERDLCALLDQHRPNCVKNGKDHVASEIPRTDTMRPGQIGLTSFSSFEPDGRALDGIALGENVDMADINHTAVNDNIVIKHEKDEIKWKINESQNNFSYFGTNFDLLDSSYGSRSYGPARFIGVDARFVVL